LNESSKGVEFQKLNTSNDPFAEVDQFRFGAFASAKDGFLGLKGLWGLRIEVYDNDEFRTVVLTAESGSWKKNLATAMGGGSTAEKQSEIAKNSFKKGLGREKAGLVIERLQRADPQLQVDDSGGRDQ